MAYSASSWRIGVISRQGPVKVFNYHRGRIVAVCLWHNTATPIVRMDLLLGKATIRRVGDPGPTLRNIVNRFFELAKAERYEAMLKNETLFIRDKIRNTVTQVTGDGITLKLPTKCSFYVLGQRPGEYHEFESVFGNWTSSYEEGRQNAAEVAAPEQRAEAT